jgi:hypothetical protein
MWEGEEIKLDLRSSFGMKKGGNKQPVTGSPQILPTWSGIVAPPAGPPSSRAPSDADLGDRSMFTGSSDGGSLGRWQDLSHRP